MSRSLPLAEIGVLAPYVAFLEKRGAAADRLLDRHNLSVEMVRRESGKITKFQGYQFLQESARREGIRNLGYHVGEIAGLDAIGGFRDSVNRAATLKDAVNTLAAQFSFWIGDNRLWLERDGEHVWLLNASADGLHGMRDVANQCGVMLLVALVREAAGARWRPKRVRIGESPSRMHESFEALHDSEVEFTPDLIGVLFPSRFLTLPIRNRGSGAPSATPVELPEDRFGIALETVLQFGMQFRRPPLVAEAAAIAGISRRTLHRRLREDGLSFQSLLDRVRFRLARDRLRSEPGISTRDLAKELHFGSASSFVRSFRRIAGVTPRVFARLDRSTEGSDSDARQLEG
jgi:AraC-like DNA-binding protein